jgi:hypothetical protein
MCAHAGWEEGWRGHFLACGKGKYIKGRLHSFYQKEGMGLLEYHAMPSLPKVAHDGWLCMFPRMPSENLRFSHGFQ